MAAVALRLEDYVPTDLGVGEGPPQPKGSLQADLSALEAARAALEAHSANVEARLAAFEEGFVRLLQTGEDLLSKGIAANLDEVIERLRTWEQTLAKDVEPLIAAARRHRTQAMRFPEPRERAKAVSAWDRQIRVLVRGPEMLRDARWRVLALRADAERQGGKRFDSADELVRYLDSL